MARTGLPASVVTAPGKGPMRQLWNRLNYRIRNRVYWHSLPIFLLAVLCLGFFSWSMYKGHADRSLRELQELELSACLDRLATTAAGEAMSLETRKARLLAGTTCGRCRGDVFSCRLQAADFGAAEFFAGLTFIQADGPSAGQPLVTRLFAQDALARPYDPQVLAPWLQENRTHLEALGSPAGGGNSLEPSAERSAVQSAVRSAGPSAVRSAPMPVTGYPWHTVLLFPPVIVRATDLAGSADTAGGGMPLLPVLIQENVVQANSMEQDSTPRCHSLYYLDLAKLMTRTAPAQWWCAVDGQGRILAGSEPGMRPGLTLADLPRGGLRTGHWLVSEGGGGRLPFTLLAGRSDADLQAFMAQFTLWGLALVVLAVVLAVLGLTRVVNSVTGRLAELGRSMRMVARGDLSRRLPAGEHDEVGSLFDYFNDMAGNLEQTNRQARENAEQLQASLLDMRILDRAKQDFLVLISHEVRTPLTAIMGGVDYLKSALDKVDEREGGVVGRLNLPEVLGIIENNGLRLRGFMNDALLMINFQAANRKIVMKSTPVRGLVAGVLASLAPKIQAKELTVVNEVGAADGWSVLGDPDLLKVALEKILDNAVTHNVPRGLVTIREAAAVPALGAVEDLCVQGTVPQGATGAYGPFEAKDIRWRLLEVYNTGEAIPAGKREALFNTFELVGPIRNHQKGTGLSLPLAQTAVERQGGRIFVHSQEAQGNSFYLMLPTVAEDAVPSSPASGALWENVSEGLGGVAGDEDVDQMADPAWFEIEFGNGRAPAAGGVHQPGGGIDGPGGAHDQQEVTSGGRLR